MTTTPSDVKRLTTQIPTGDADRLEKLAAKNERTVAAEIRLAISRHLLAQNS